VTQIEIFFNRLEANLRLLIEGDASQDGFPPKLHRQLLRELVSVMKGGMRKQVYRLSPASPVLIAPDQYTLVLPAIEAQILLSHPSELDRLTRKLEILSADSGIGFIAPPILRVVANPQCTEMNIKAEYTQPGMEDSSTYQLDDLPEASGHLNAERLPKAFLIVNGVSTFFIEQPVVNIGRDPSNQLQLDDPQISRRHAQLRFIQGHFIIFDLDSLSGTLVNGVPVSSRVLAAGDVIRLACLPLVFGLEETSTAGQTQQLPADQPPPEVL